MESKKRIGGSAGPSLKNDYNSKDQGLVSMNSVLEKRVHVLGKKIEVLEREASRNKVFTGLLFVSIWITLILFLVLAITTH